jgi:hypothetical protein
MWITEEEVARATKCGICGDSIWDDGDYFRFPSFWFSARAENTPEGGIVDLVWYKGDDAIGVNVCPKCVGAEIDAFHAKGVRICETSPA